MTCQPWVIFRIITYTKDNKKRTNTPMGLLPDMQNHFLLMHREWRERFPRHHGLAIRHASRHVSGARAASGRENFLGIPGTCATHNFAYLVRSSYGLYAFRPRRNDCSFADDTVKFLFFVWKSSNFRFKLHWFFANGLIDNILSYVRTMAWYRARNKPLSEPSIASFTTA